MSELDEFEEAPATTEPALNSLLKDAEELIGLEIQIADIEQLLKTLSGRANNLKLKTIPDKLSEIGISTFSTPGGDEIKVEEFVSGALPKEPEKRKAAIEVVEGWGAEGVIKSQIVLSFEKSQHNEALALVDDLRKQGHECELASSIHASTYLALIREHLAKGKQVDAEKMGVFVGRKAKVVLKKIKK